MVFPRPPGRGKGSILLVEQPAGDIAAQSPTAVDWVVLLGAGVDLFAASQPALEIELQELGFQAALGQQLMDVQEVVAEVAVIDVALDGCSFLISHSSGFNLGRV